MVQASCNFAKSILVKRQDEVRGFLVDCANGVSLLLSRMEVKFCFFVRENPLFFCLYVIKLV